MCDEINVCVPTGNFGNIFAAYLAKKMGLPINKLICASNSNKILTDFFTTGKYDKNRDFYTTMSPSMDILISSNLERLLYLIFGEVKTKDCMKQLADTGCYKISCQTRNKIGKDFVGMCCNEEETMATIKKIFDEDKYLCDTHTAVALKCAKEYIENTGDKTQMVVASTASPYKFASSVCRSLGLEVTDDEFECLSTLSSYTKTEIPVNLASLKEKKVRFDKTIKADEMTDEVYSQLKINLK